MLNSQAITRTGEHSIGGVMDSGKCWHWWCCFPSHEILHHGQCSLINFDHLVILEIEFPAIEEEAHGVRDFICLTTALELKFFLSNFLGCSSHSFAMFHIGFYFFSSFLQHKKDSFYPSGVILEGISPCWSSRNARVGIPIYFW